MVYKNFSSTLIIVKCFFHTGTHRERERRKGGKCMSVHFLCLVNVSANSNKGDFV
jgi:hypothetical protein